MKNYEKYAEEIKRWAGRRNFCDEFIEPVILKQLGENCETTSCELCNTLRMMWLLEEYEEPKESEVDWSKVKVDTPILVRDYEGQKWARRYFAKYENETVYAWDGGRTSWSGDGVTEWKYAKLAESGEGDAE